MAAASKNGARPRHSQATKDQAAELRAAGWTYPAIAAEVGAAEGTVVYWLNPKTTERTRQRSKAWKEANPDRRRQTQKEYDTANRKRQTKRDLARRKRATQALNREKRDLLASRGARHGAAEAYALVRRALLALENPRNDHKGARAAANDAMVALHEAEDRIVEALKLGA